MQLNPKLKQLFSYKDFKDATPFLFGEQFSTQAKDCLEAAKALRKTMATENSKKGFQKGHNLPEKVAGVATTTAAQEGVEDGRGLATKPRNGTRHQRND